MNNHYYNPYPNSGYPRQQQLPPLQQQNNNSTFPVNAQQNQQPQLAQSAGQPSNKYVPQVTAPRQVLCNQPQPNFNPYQPPPPQQNNNNTFTNVQPFQGPQQLTQSAGQPPYQPNSSGQFFPNQPQPNFNIQQPLPPQQNNNNAFTNAQPFQGPQQQPAQSAGQLSNQCAPQVTTPRQFPPNQPQHNFNMQQPPQRNISYAFPVNDQQIQRSQSAQSINNRTNYQTATQNPNLQQQQRFTQSQQQQFTQSQQQRFTQSQQQQRFTQSQQQQQQYPLQQDVTQYYLSTPTYNTSFNSSQTTLPPSSQSQCTSSSSLSSDQLLQSTSSDVILISSSRAKTIISELEKFENDKSFNTHKCASILKDYHWDPRGYEEIRDRFCSHDEIYKVFVACFTIKLLPAYKDLRFRSGEALANNDFYNHPDKYCVEQDLNRIKPPSPLIGLTKKYTEYDYVNFEIPSHKYPQTVVNVLNEDTLSVAKNILREEMSVCVLSMTHPKKPGGSWKSGYWGQEESLFVRTTLSCGVNKFFYPLNYYDSMFLKDVVVIREGDDNNFAFLPQNKRYKVDVVSISGLHLKSEDDTPVEMTPEHINIVRLKIRSLFLVCIENGVSNLVLGALGCGIFNNDPETVAKIFREELSIFAGFFNKVYFAVLDKEEGGTFDKFNKIITGEESVYRPHVDWFHTEVMPTLKSVVPCEKGCMCTDNSPEHFRDKDHLPLCFDIKDCCSEDSVHKACFRHKELCPFQKYCTQFEDEGHTKYFNHELEKCRYGAYCTNISPEHLSEYLHYPVCTNDPCDLGEDHMAKMRHLKKMDLCSDDPTGCACANIKDEKGKEEHFKRYAHICENGLVCTEKENLQHSLCSNHELQECKCKSDCKDLSEAHIRTYWHHGQSVRREKCSKWNCHNYERDHRLQVAHPAEVFGRSDINMINVRDLSLSKKTFVYSDSPHSYFRTNIIALSETTTGYIKRLGIEPSDLSEKEEIKRWFTSLLPTHMCSGEVFKSILKLRSLNSLDKLQKLWGDEGSLIEIAFTSKTGQEIMKKAKNVATNYGKMYLSSIRSEEIAKIEEEIKKIDIEPDDGMNEDQKGKKMIEKARLIKIKEKLGKTVVNPEINRDRMAENRLTLIDDVKEGNVVNFENLLRDLEENALMLLRNSFGVRDDKDQYVCTDKCVFGILGPNNSVYGNSDCVIIFKEDLMYHVDYFETLCAATFYVNGRYRKTKDSEHVKNIWFDRTPWMGQETHIWACPDQSQDSRNIAKETYYSEKYNHIDDVWGDAMAQEFILRVKSVVDNGGPLSSPKEIDKINLKDVQGMIRMNNSHSMIETHLPSSFSLDYIEHVIMKKDLYDDLMSDEKISAEFTDFIRNKGDDFITIIECAHCEDCKDGKCERCSKSDHDNIVDAEFSFFDERMKMPYRQKPQGYSLGLYSENIDKSEYFIPAGEYLRMNRNASATITFAAFGGGFWVRIGNEGDKKCTNGERDFYTFGIDSINMGLYCTHAHGDIGNDSMFNICCRKDDWIYYCITVDYENSQITIRHDGPSYVFNKREFKIECSEEGGKANKDIHKFTYASVLTEKGNKTSIRDFNIKFSRSD